MAAEIRSFSGTVAQVTQTGIRLREMQEWINFGQFYNGPKTFNPGTVLNCSVSVSVAPDGKNRYYAKNLTPAGGSPASPAQQQSYDAPPIQSSFSNLPPAASSSWNETNKQRSEDIARAVALKAAVDTVLGKVSAEDTERVLKLAASYLAFLTGEASQASSDPQEIPF